MSQAKTESKIIKGILNPCPKIRGCKIKYRRAGQYIYFSAWYNEETNGKEFRVHRSQVLTDRTFYRRHFEDLGWLTL
jgi:hypothetical protein